MSTTLPVGKNAMTSMWIGLATVGKQVQGRVKYNEVSKWSDLSKHLFGLFGASDTHAKRNEMYNRLYGTTGTFANWIDVPVTYENDVMEKGLIALLHTRLVVSPFASHSARTHSHQHLGWVCMSMATLGEYDKRGGYDGVTKEYMEGLVGHGVTHVAITTNHQNNYQKMCSTGSNGHSIFSTNQKYSNPFATSAKTVLEILDGYYNLSTTDVRRQTLSMIVQKDTKKILLIVLNHKSLEHHSYWNDDTDLQTNWQVAGKNYTTFADVEIDRIV